MLDGICGVITTFTTDNNIMELKNNTNMELTYHEHPTKEDLLEYFGRRIRVRKMHQIESFLLMDCSMEDIEKIISYPFRNRTERDLAIKEAATRRDKKELSRIRRESISKTNCYKLAGNSIVVSCLYHIFRTLFLPNQPENQKSCVKQFGLFDFTD